MKRGAQYQEFPVATDQSDDQNTFFLFMKRVSCQLQYAAILRISGLLSCCLIVVVRMNAKLFEKREFLRR